MSDQFSDLKTKSFYVFFVFLVQFIIVVVCLMNLMIGLLKSSFLACIDVVFE